VQSVVTQCNTRFGAKELRAIEVWCRARQEQLSEQASQTKAALQLVRKIEDRQSKAEIVIGDGLRWAKLKAAIHKCCGEKWNQVCDGDDLAVLYHAALGESTKSEVSDKGGFAGTWNNKIQLDVDDVLCRMENSKQHRTAAEQLRKEAGLEKFSRAKRGNDCIAARTAKKPRDGVAISLSSRHGTLVAFGSKELRAAAPHCN
jgi:hypothetical protein